MATGGDNDNPARIAIDRVNPVDRHSVDENDCDDHVSGFYAATSIDGVTASEIATLTSICCAI